VSAGEQTHLMSAGSTVLIEHCHCKDLRCEHSAAPQHWRVLPLQWSCTALHCVQARSASTLLPQHACEHSKQSAVSAEQVQAHACHSMRRDKLGSRCSASHSNWLTTNLAAVLGTLQPPLYFGIFFHVPRKRTSNHFILNFMPTRQGGSQQEGE